jgi:hypothetical protein
MQVGADILWLGFRCVVDPAADVQVGIRGQEFPDIDDA